jgi:fido (protein-threonine AMPylation protein)
MTKSFCSVSLVRSSDDKSAESWDEVTNDEATAPLRGRPKRQLYYQRFESAIEELARYGGLPKPYEAQGLWDDLWYLEAHHSTAIEGNTLVLREVEALLKEKRAVGAKELKDYLEVLGYGEAAKWVYEHATTSTGDDAVELITLSEVREIHHTAMVRVWDVAPHPEATPAESPGNFRQHEIAQFGGGMQPPTWPVIHSELTFWVDDVNGLRRDLTSGDIGLREVPERLAAIHREFERIHPFIDGNGRTGRLALNLILVRLGWPPSIILKNQRPRYLTALDRADKSDLGPLAELISRSVVDNLHRLIPNIAGPSRYVLLQALADPELSLVALKGAASRGRLAANLGSDGQWRSSRAEVEAYKASRYRR